MKDDLGISRSFHARQKAYDAIHERRKTSGAVTSEYFKTYAYAQNRLV